MFVISTCRAWEEVVMPARFQEEWGGEIVCLGAPRPQEVALWAGLSNPHARKKKQARQSGREGGCNGG